MDLKENNNSNKGRISSQFPTVLNWEEPFTDQDLEAIDAIEAAFQLQSTLTATITSSSSVIKKRNSSPQNDQDSRNTRRQLPSSIPGLSKPFSLSPCQANMKMRYPAMKFGGHILYSRTTVEVEKAANELLRCFEAKKREIGQVTVGFDIEWKPTFRRGVLPGKAAVMQICIDTQSCYVMHIIHSGITPSLQSLLEDSAVSKVGVSIGGDCRKVLKDYKVSVKAAEDLSALANEKLGGEPKVWGLKTLTELLVCKELQKPNNVRLGNWEIDVLSKEQLQYAATDAFASWQLYQVLKSFPDAKDKADKKTEEQVGQTATCIVPNRIT